MSKKKRNQARHRVNIVCDKILERIQADYHKRMDQHVATLQRLKKMLKK